MGQEKNGRSEELEQEIGGIDVSLESFENSQVIGLLKRLQQQVAFLERKVDRLTDLLEKNPEREHYHSKFSDKGKSSYYGKSERKFSRGRSGDDDKRSGGYHKEKDYSSGKPSGKTFGKPSGKSFGKPSGKTFGKPGGAKKKVFSSKRKTGKF